MGHFKGEILQTKNGIGPTGIPNHWVIAPIYRDAETGETWCAEDEARSVHPDLGRKCINSGSFQKIGECEQTDMRAGARSIKWHDQGPRKKPGPIEGKRGPKA